MRRIFGGASREEDSEWLSVSDLMAGLMVIFLFIAVAFIRPVAEENRQVKDIARAWEETENRIADALRAEFSEDFRKWNAALDEKTLLIRFQATDVQFSANNSEVRPEFAAILREFFPRYVSVLSPFKEAIEEIRVEGHTSSDWRGSDDPQDRYFGNMELSQSRARAVLQHVMRLPQVEDERGWLTEKISTNGFSSGRTLKIDGVEDSAGSRRVEFRILTNSGQQIRRILETVR